VTKYQPQQRGWLKKFASAFHGIALGASGQSSFLVHAVVSCLVVMIAAWLQVTPIEWCLLVICIAVVMAAEIFNSALELLAKAITDEEQLWIAQALDIASGAVLITAIAAAVVGVLILLPKFIAVLGY
jgi:diacylglycerol kinase